jgi:hypothetical protein
MMETSFMSLFGLFFSGGLFTGLPVGLPPTAPDPVMSQVAPEDTMVYIGWSGTGEASADSTNNTERLLAEPQVKQLVSQIIKVLNDSIKQGAGAGNNARQVAIEIPKVIQTILTRPTCLFVGQVGIGPTGVNAPLGLVVNVGENADDFAKSFQVLQKLIADEEGETETKRGTTWHIWPTLPGVPKIAWGVSNGYFILGVGDGTVEQIQARMKTGKEPAFLAKIKKRLPIDRVASVTYFNIDSIIKTVKPLMAGAAPGFDAILLQLGLDELKGLSSVTGLEGTHCVSRTWIELGPKRTGVLGIVDSEPLTAADLSPIPADATFAIAAKLNVGETIQRVVDLVAKFEPRAGEEFERETGQVAEILGFHPMNDLAKSVGDRWCLFQSPAQGGPIFTGWTAVASVENPKKLKDIAAKMSAFVTVQNNRFQQTNRRRREIGIKRTTVGNHTVYFMNSIGEEMPVAPAWCVTDDEVIFSLYPQGVTEYLRQRNTPRLSSLPQVKERLAAKPMTLSYYDSRAIFDSVYPLALLGANFLFGELQREGIDLNISMVPTASSISKHLQPSSSSIQVTKDGIEMYSNRTLPIALESMQSLALPFLLFSSRSRGMNGPPVLSVLSPRRSREVANKNNMKQIGIAMHNYHDTFNRFPPGGLDENGKAGLSWRVHLLPFMEQAALYNEFNLDEPWDSEHNKALIGRMPTAYKSPGSKNTKAGQTNYVAMRHENAVITGKQGKRIADIRDGTSNTIMVVEADDKQAVTWTKPDDLDFDPKKPHTGLGTLRNGQFFALFCDGSVRGISSKITAETLKRLVDRQDGKVINRGALDGETQGRDAEAVPADAVPDVQEGRVIRRRAVPKEDKAVAP